MVCPKISRDFTLSLLFIFLSGLQGLTNGGVINNYPTIIEFDDCNLPDHIPNGQLSIIGNKDIYIPGNEEKIAANNTQIIIECDEGFIFSDGPQIKTCIMGEWTPKPDMNCIREESHRYVWEFENLKKRGKRAVKGGGGSLVRSKSVGGGSGGGKNRRGKKKIQASGGSEEEESDVEVCDDLDEDPLVQMEVIKEGGENETLSNGAVVKVSCSIGYGNNLLNDTLTCVDGRWKPKVPNCTPLPCKVPYITHGTFYESGKGLLFSEPIKHTKKIELKCSKGYQLTGARLLSCWFGEFDTHFQEAPECNPAKCTLPQLDHGNYMGGLKSGSNISQDTEVDYTCTGDFRKYGLKPIICQSGDFTQKPMCLHPSVSLNYTGLDVIGENDNGGGGKKSKKGKDGPRKLTGNKGKCKLPHKEQGVVAYMEGIPVDFEFSDSFPEGTEITFRCITVKPKSKNRWKLTCENGNWVGDPLTCEIGENNDDSSVANLVKMINGPCTFVKKNTETVTFFEDQRLDKDGDEFPTGSILTSRCIDIGKYQLHGNIRRKCISGQWIGISPNCEGLSQLKDYSLVEPPTILFRYHNGSITQSNDGKLFVYPGTTLHMECLWIRKFGSPIWDASNGKNYSSGWTEEEGRDPTLEFRVSIIEASDEDSGIFTCTTPARYATKIEIIVRTQVCDIWNPDDYPGVEFSTTSNLMGTKINFKCKTGNALMGDKDITCQSSGKWSGSIPRCENVECPDISLLPAMAPLAYSIAKNGSISKNGTSPSKIAIFGRSVGGRATFTCEQGFSVVGNNTSICQGDGTWSSPIPLCKEVECTEPNHPENGYVSGNPPYKAGDLAQFECHSGYMMEGQPVVACQDNGEWSKANVVKCLQACTYPGTTIGGTISKVRFHYAIAETVTFDCQDGYDLQGARLLHCLRNGKWSNSIPQCVPKNGGRK